MNGRYVVDENSKKVAVLLDIKEYERMVEELEELEDQRIFDEAMEELEGGAKARPLKEVAAELEREQAEKPS